MVTEQVGVQSIRTLFLLCRNLLLRAQGCGDPLPRVRPVLHVRSPGTTETACRARLGRCPNRIGVGTESIFSVRAAEEGGGSTAHAKVRAYPWTGQIRIS